MFALLFFMRFLEQEAKKTQVKGGAFENANFCSSSRKAKILTTGIHGVFRGLKFEPDAKVG